MCPECGDPLVAFELSGVEIDHCVECRGTWLDSGELEMIAELADADPGPLAESVRTARRQRRGERTCPRCSARMDVVRVGDDSAVEIDRCPRGHGLWFDQGELRTAIQNSSAGEGGVVAAFFADLYRTELEGENS